MADGHDPKNSALEAYWMPFTANKAFKAQPRMLASAKDMHYVTPDGRKILDATAGLWCVNAGHGRDSIVAAIREAAGRLDYAPSFQLGHPAAFDFARQLADILPEGMDHVFFCNSGSEAVDSALKIALAWQRAAGRGTRTRLIGRERAYHGVGFGGISVGGIVTNRAPYGALLPGVDHLRHTYDPSQGIVRGQPERGAELADDLERLVGLHGADNIAAVIVEPLAGSTGVLVPPTGYLERLRAICDKHQILLIFDEVITGFGRLGAATAAERFGVTPDIMTLAKGLTNAAVPMGAVGVRREIYEGMMEAIASGIELPHGYTYSGHPLAVAAGQATLDIYRDEGLFLRAADLEPVWEAAVHGLADAPHVKDVRNLGLVAGIELESRPGAAGQRATEVFRACFDAGLLVRVTGDIIALSPPLIISPAQIDQTVQTIADVLRRTA
ncbi:aspartate aminotransferase family protein [Phenylobacterium sp. LjRoot225]|uniref:aspartate aminotransferase family protein n=1 Tax=Phenylobacterium sp. LjRoot225 TaxID=3342285 RepID=UPI003ECFC388